MADAVSVAEDKPRHEFMYDWPAQITCSALRIIYTEEVNIAFEQLEEGNENALK
jgi:dynein heavy chain